MWELFRVQINYFKFHYFFAWGFTLLLAALLLLTGVESAYVITMGSSTIVIVIFCISLGVICDKEKQNRVLVLLPLKVNQIIITQIMLVLFLLGGMVIIWFITYMAQPAVTIIGAGVRIITFCSYLINWIFFFWIWGDLAYAGKYYFKVVFLFFIITFIITAVIIGSYFGISVISWFTFSVTNPETFFELISMVSLSVVLIIVEYKIFIQRKSYLT
ncbi:MAG: hypothetical protein R6V04_05860 [bacterium]